MDIINYILVLIFNVFLLYVFTKDANYYNIYLSKTVKIMFFFLAPFIIIWYLIKRNKIVKTIKYYLIENSKETESIELSQLIDMVKNERMSREQYIKTNICSEGKTITIIPQVRPLFNLPKLRHWFITLCIWVCVAFHLLLVSGLLFYRSEITRYIPQYYSSTYVFSIFMYAIIFIGFCLLLGWKKIGFWIIIMAQSIMDILRFFHETEIGVIYFSIVNAFLLFGILNLRKNGLSAWEQSK